MTTNEIVRPRIAVVHPYWDFWEHTVGPTFRSDRLATVRLAASSLAIGLEVVSVDDFASPIEAAELGERFALVGVDAVLIIQTMAVPSAYAIALAKRLPRVPIVVWAMHETGRIQADFDHAAVTREGATVGAPMLVNVLSRYGHPFDLVLGRLSDRAAIERVNDALRVAAAARRIARARLGRVGGPQDGYLHVDVDDDALRLGTGIELVRIDPAEVIDRYRQVEDRRVLELEIEIRRNWQIADDVDSDRSLERSLRMALAMEDIVGAHALDGGALNCHIPQIRFNDEIGITPCFGLGRLTSMGYPWTCTGDVLTAVAMLTTKRLGGAAVYHEIEAIDYETDEVVIANSGEHDLAWLAPGERPRLGRNGWFCGVDRHCGVCAVLEPAPGPATLVAFTPHPDARGGFRYVVARGELTQRRFPSTGTVNGAFRFTDGPVEDAWVRWAKAGVNHHSSATPGDLAADVRGVARYLGVEAIVI